MDTYSSLLLKASTYSPAHIFMLVGIIVLLFCSAFFSSAETTFTSMNALRMRNFAENKVKGARKALYISEHYEMALTTILVGNNFVNILSTTLCAYLFGIYVTNPTVANLLNTVVMTIIILIFGEILPKCFAKTNPEKFALAFSGPLFVLMKVLYPIVIIFYGLQLLLTRKQRAKNKATPTVTEDELESIIDTMEEEGVLEKDDADLIQGTIKIREVDAKDIMTHRVDVIFVEDTATDDEINNLFLEHKYSRLPVFSKTTDNIIGILNQKDYFFNLIENKKPSITDIITPATFISESTNVNSIIDIMKKERQHMVIVIDDQGGTSGIVTMEDCLETIVGEIYDESDDEEEAPTIETVQENEYNVDANVTVEEVFNQLKIEKMPEEKYVSIASFVLENYQGMPELGTIIEYPTVDEIIDDNGDFITKHINMIFTVTEFEEHRIKKLNLKIEYVNIEKEPEKKEDEEKTDKE